MGMSLTELTEWMQETGWTVIRTFPRTVRVEAGPLAAYQVHANRGSRYVRLEVRFREGRRIVILADSARSAAELEAARGDFEGPLDLLHEKLLALYPERGWSIDPKRTSHVSNGWDDPTWHVSATREGDRLDVGFVYSTTVLGERGAIREDDTGHAYVRTGRLFGVAHVLVCTDAEAIRALL